MKVLIIDGSPDVAEVVSLCFELRWPGTAVVSAPDGPTGLEAVERDSPDLVVLDIGLPVTDGYQVCRQIRSTSQAPIIMLTVRDQDTDIARGLEAGADDYITKPFSHIELLARVKAVLRRAHEDPLGEDEPPFTCGELRLDFTGREVRMGEQKLRLTPIEYQVLAYLVKHAGQLVPHRALLSRVWGPGYSETGNSLKVHIQHLRAKLGDDGPNPRMIVTERGTGY
jgi:DNA-binding response OmpR family regulator